jgi:hypothetical protein
MKMFLRSLALAGLLGVYLPSSAQVFTTPVAHEHVFPSGTTGALLNPETSSAYSISGIMEPVSGAWADLYLSGWSGPSDGGFAWQFTNINDPTTVIQDGYIPYPNGRDVEVGLVDGGPGGRQILVAYHLAGVGHFLDVYDLIPGAGITLGYSMPLSSAPNYSRISMDCHLTYGVAIVWENTSNGALEAMGGSSGSWGPIVTLPWHPSGAASWDPDVAFSHAGPLNVHIVSMAPGEITESVVSWPDLMSGSLASYMVEDNNLLPPGPMIHARPVIDCTDHSGVESWAYAYTLDDARINVRYVNFLIGGAATTASINDGSLPWGNAPTIGSYSNKMPSLAYSPTGSEIYVAWYVETLTGGGTNQYIALRMRADGSGISNIPDYMGIPNSVTPLPYPTVPGISLSKMNDMNPSFLYAAYYDHGAGYQMHNAYHQWGMPVFKGAAATNAHQLYHPECGSKQTTTSALTAHAAVKVSPNPFTNVISALVNTDHSGTARLQLTDITGRTVSQSQVTIEKGIRSIQTSDLKNLAAGTYILNVFMDDVRIGQQQVVKQ